MNRHSAQRHRVNRVVNHAYQNLAGPLDLDRLAEVACLSKYHFIRVFTAHQRESPVQFLWRLRLERAARSLVIRRDTPITDIALDCGFSCSQTFSRAFRRRFDLAPRALRAPERRPFDGLVPSPQGAVSDKRLRSRWEQSPLRIEARPAQRLAYVRNLGLYWNVDGAISEAYRRLVRWARHRGLWAGATEMIGLCPDNAAVTPAGYCLYDACLPVSDEIGEDDVVSIQTIPAGRYAVLSVRATPTEMESAWKWLTLTWSRHSDLPCELVQSFERFPVVGGRTCGPEEQGELWLRLKSA